MPLAYPSTLDRLPSGCATDGQTSYVEGRWSPSLDASRKNRKQKHKQCACGMFRGDARRVFLSQAGPRVELVFFKLGITSW
jgi:hypothetical protein